MQPATHNLLESLLELPQQERAEIALKLIRSLDAEQDDTDYTALWAAESESRLAAAKRGDIQKVSEADVFAKYSIR